MLPLNEDVLKKFWYPVIPLQSLEQEPCSFQLLGISLVLWRNVQGEPQAAIDRCCHRSAKLSLGQVTPEGLLQCPYHGWQFDGTGKCCLIPQQPDEKIPHNFKINIVACQAKYGYVWVCLSEPSLFPIPEFPEEIDPSFRRFHGFYEEWNCAAIRYVENALDNSHHYFAHHNLLQTITPIPDPIETITETATGICFSMPLVFANNFALSKSIANQETTLINRRITEWHAPFGVVLAMSWPNGLRHHIVSFVVPKDNQTTQFIRFYFRNNVVSEQTDQEVINLDRQLTNQDRQILESIDFDSPLDVTTECSMAIDKPILMMRRKLAQLLAENISPQVM